jgi:hypothetical protein
MTVPFLFLTAALATGAAAAQQATTPPPPSVSVEGCVVTENEIPGRKANLAERAGLAEDFILVGAKVVKGKAPAVPKDDSGGVVSAGLRPMYEIGGLTDEQLKVHVGRRVRIEGSFGNLDRDATPSDPKNDDLVELNVATIRQIPGNCTMPKS